MSNRLHGPAFVAVVIALGGCNAAMPPPDAGGGGTDAGSDAAPDAGSDGGSDAAIVSTTDTGVDAATDAFVPPADVGGACHDDYAGCTAATTEDHRSDTTVRITVPDLTTMYDHPCIRIHAGTMVVIDNNNLHPLLVSSCSTPGGPFPSTLVPDAVSTTYTFPAAGHYGYHCNEHGSDDGTFMAGLVIVE